MSGPFPRASFEVLPETQGALIALLGGLREQLHHDLRHRFGNGRVDHVRGRGVLGDVPMDHFKRIVRSKGACAGQDFVQNYTQRVEVRAVVRSTIHASSLLRRHVRERSERRLS